jgi:putative salt-induced outer membrane protein YdiY
MASMGLLFLLLLCPRLYADQVTLKNGDRISGTILKSDTKALVIKTESAGEVTIQWAAIDSITSSQPLHVGLTGGQMMVGPVTTSDGKIQVATQTAGTVTTSKDSVQVMRSDSEQAAYDAQIERLRSPRLTDFWGGVLDAGLTLTRGNSATFTSSLSGKAVRTTPRDKISVYTTAIYGTNDNVSPSQTTAHETRGGIRVDVNFTERWFAFGLTDFDSNALQHLDLQNVVAGGIGYHAIKTERATFDLFGGAGYNQQYFSAYSLPNPTPPPPTTDYPAVTQRNATMLVGEELDTKLNKKTTFGENFTFYPGVGGAGGYRFTFNTTLSTKLKNWLGWQITYSDNYISNPPAGIKGNDMLLSTGLRLTVGKQ